MDLVEVFDVSDFWVRNVNNIKSNSLEQFTIVFDCSYPVNVDVNEDVLEDVVKVCFVNKNDLFYIYFTLFIDENNNRYAKYLIDDVLNIIV